MTKTLSHRSAIFQLDNDDPYSKNKAVVEFSVKGGCDGVLEMDVTVNDEYAVIVVDAATFRNAIAGLFYCEERRCDQDSHR